jgi:hypothetical protein
MSFSVQTLSTLRVDTPAGTAQVSIEGDTLSSVALPDTSSSLDGNALQNSNHTFQRYLILPVPGDPNYVDPDDLKPQPRPRNKLYLEAQRLLSVLTYDTYRVQGEEPIQRLFETYLDEQRQKKTIFFNQRNHVTRVNALRTRYTSKTYKKRQIKTFDAVTKFASSKYKTGVFSTFTVDPSKYPSLLDAYDGAAAAWNRLLTWIRKKEKKEGKTFVVQKQHEFTKNGMIHFHVIFYGLDRLMDYRELRDLWNRQGGGRVVYLYRIVQAWGKLIWIHPEVDEVPEEMQKTTAPDYLRKYLVKALHQDECQALYWAYGARYGSHSERIIDPAYKVQETEWIFVGIFPEGEIPDELRALRGKVKEIIFLDEMDPGGWL